ncbi:TM2 domain-containing protein [Bartonella sp. AU55XJBT]|uniref:TM2 domain-containing protein n=1 Tax=Bartonella sp. AU55XJBT TaxID=3019091 RepID=UPI00235F9A6F|nr:TM2 domain-containing protein [Bartonella sp. AU55XJBT]
MKGKIIGQDQGDYLVSGDDGKRYQFADWNWLGKKTPKIGDVVDFVYEDNIVKSVLPLLSRKESEQTRLGLAVICFFLGWLGIHRFMAGKVGTGLVMLLINITVIGFFINLLWSFIDFVVILSGSFKDGDGNKITKL